MPEFDPETLSAMIEHARLLRVHYLSDPHRPGYHFVAPEGVHAPVDPNGALFWNGRYHLCYIYQHKHEHYWGHVSSHDLVHWRHHPPALSPGSGGDDGIFSGGAFIDRGGVATISYWRLGKPDGVAIATSTDPDLDVWTKQPANPVIPSTGDGLVEKDGVVYGSADPSQIWEHNGRYYMVTGNLLVLREFGEKRDMPEHRGDTAYLLVSDDLVHWEYLHPFYQSRREWTFNFEDCMCPDFFELPASPEGGDGSGKYMLLFISHTLGCQYYIGDYRADRFYPEQHGRMSWPPSPEQHRKSGFHDHGFFAPESLTDDRGRRIMWAWIFDHRQHETKLKTGWSGELSLPRLLWLGEDGALRMKPADELAALRYSPVRRSGMKVAAGSAVTLPGIEGNSLEIAIDFERVAGKCGVRVCRAPDGSEETEIAYDALDGALSVDTTRSSLGEGRKIVEVAPLRLAYGEPLTLRIFVDRSVIEVFANDRQAMARRIYPTRPDSAQVQLFAEGEDVDVREATAWKMMPSNPY